jgi:hypothetical protein
LQDSQSKGALDIRMRKLKGSIERLSGSLLTTVLVLCGGAASAQAGSVTFNFNSLSDTATVAQIETYMNGALAAAGCTGCTVVVSNGTYADQSYNGGGHTVGPGTGGTSLTLGNTNGATNSTTTIGSTDTFLANTSDTDASTASQITMQFQGFTINGGIGFDYEIFPNFTCTALSSSACGGAPVGGIYPDQPRFELEAGTSSASPVTSFGTSGTQYGYTPGTANGSVNTSSPSSPKPRLETGPQYIGTWSTTSSSLNGDTQLDFVDWPATIGIDNLQVSFSTNTPSPVPEPASLLLLGTAVFCCIRGLRRRTRQA